MKDLCESLCDSFVQAGVYCNIYIYIRNKATEQRAKVKGNRGHRLLRKGQLIVGVQTHINPNNSRVSFDWFILVEALEFGHLNV